jgi:hypothetical protein
MEGSEQGRRGPDGVDQRPRFQDRACPEELRDALTVDELHREGAGLSEKRDRSRRGKARVVTVEYVVERDERVVLLFRGQW